MASGKKKKKKIGKVTLKKIASLKGKKSAEKRGKEAGSRKSFSLPAKWSEEHTETDGKTICFHLHQKIEINFVVWLLMVSATIYMINSFLVLGLLVHVTPSIFFSRIVRSEALVYKSYFCQNTRSPEFFRH